MTRTKSAGAKPHRTKYCICVFLYFHLLFFLGDLLFVRAERIAPRIDDIIIMALKSQDIGVLFTSIISPNIQNTDENNKKTKHPHISPQSRASEHLFFFADINPPKNDEAYMEKNENGVISEWGLLLTSPISENNIRSARRIAEDTHMPNTAEVSAPLFDTRFFSFILFFIKNTPWNFLLQYITKAKIIYRFEKVNIFFEIFFAFT